MSRINNTSPINHPRSGSLSPLGNSSGTKEVAVSSMVEVPDKCGWLWKHSVGKSFFGAKNWKMRYFQATVEGVVYFAQEPFDNPKGSIQWDDVTHIYASVNSDIDAAASDPKYLYFGLRFMVSPGKEKLLLLRSDDEQERDLWAQHFLSMHAESNRVKMLVDTDEEEDMGMNLRKNRRRLSLLNTLAVKLRTMVSLKKQRFQKDGFDLDLAYIIPQVIAMGFPSEGKEAVYRNPMNEVVTFFQRRHGTQFKVYNLCSERCYPPNRFGGRFARFPFDDHNPCPLEMLGPVCKDIQDAILVGPVAAAERNDDGNETDDSDAPPSSPPPPITVPGITDEDIASTIQKLEEINAEFGGTLSAEARALVTSGRNVSAIHCKAGKGRTGLVICAFLMYSGLVPNAAAAQKFFGTQRTYDGKGVQIPSQRRYLGYFESLLRDYPEHLEYPPSAPVTLRTVSVKTVPRFDADLGCDPYVLVQQRKEGHLHRPCGTKEGSFKEQMVTVYDSRDGHPVKHYCGNSTPGFSIPLMRALEGELCIVLMDEDKATRDDKMCSFWVHTGFLPPEGKYTMSKQEIDDAIKDKRNMSFAEEFSVTLEYTFDHGVPAPPPRSARPSIIAARDLL